MFFCYIMFFRHFQQCIRQNAQKTRVTAVTAILKTAVTGV